MNLVEAFEKNLLNLGLPQRTFDSILSKIFFIDDKAYKVYKYDNNFAGQFASSAYRRRIYSNEFKWNSIASPDVYISLNPVVFRDGDWIDTDSDGASDFYIVMNELSAVNNCIELLLKQRFSDDQVRSVAEYVETTINDLRLANIELVDTYKDDPKKNLEHVLINSFEEWAKLFSSCNVDNILVSKVITWLRSFFNKSSYFQDFDKTRLTVGLDNHAGNLFLFHEKPQYIDIYPPVRDWLVLDKLLSIAIIASAFTVFLGKERSDVFYRTSFGDQADGLRDVIGFYETRYSLAQGMYYDKYNRPEVAVKFFDFVRSEMNM